MLAKLFFEEILSEVIDERDDAIDIFVFFLAFIVFLLPCFFIDILLSPLEILSFFIYYIMKKLGRNRL